MREVILTEGPKWRRALLLVLVVGVPVLFMRNMMDSINVPKLGLLFIVVPLVASIRLVELLQGAEREGLRRLWIPAAALAIPLTISWLFSPYKGWALLGNYSRLGGLLAYLVVIVFGVLLADAFYGRGRTLAWAFTIAGGIVGAYALLQFVGGDPFEWVLAGEVVDRLTTSTLGNTNFAGGMLGIMLPVATGLCFSEKDRRGVALGLAAVIGLGLLVTASQGGFAAGAAGMLVTGGFILQGRWPRARLAGLAGAVAIGAVAVGVVVFSMVGPDPSPMPSTIVSRGEWWEIATRMTIDSPVVGRGPDSYALDGTRFRTVEEARKAGGWNYTDEPHNVALWFFACAGVLGGAGFLVAAGWGLREGLGLDDQNLVAAAFFGGVVAYLVQSLVSIDTVALRTAFWIVLAGLVVSTVGAPRTAASKRAASSKKRASKARSRRGPVSEPIQALPAVALVVLLGLAGAQWGLRFMAADASAKKGRDLFASGLALEGAAEFEEAIGFDDLAQYRRQYASFMGQAALVLAAQDEPVRQAQATDFYEKAREAYSYLESVPHANAIVDYARLLDRWAYYHPEVKEEALVLYHRAVELDPKNGELREEVAHVETTPGEPPEG